ncbi:MAG: RlmE family RNA methyltransferase [Candidatus Lokiarchaeota archaeon]|nr:RlmE family RNA methyltransferase [Candidatus Lokiarchaeota archaeon]
MTKNNSYKHKKDPHYNRAKREGYRARSAYKLHEIQHKYQIFKRAFYILDIGCAPGSWLQVAKEHAIKNLEKYNDQYYHREEYKIMGIDLKHVTPIDSIEILKSNITDPETRQKISNFFDDKIDLIISDASINKKGDKFTDHLNQIRLCYEIIKLIKLFLKKKGIFVLKCFQGSDFKTLHDDYKKEFHIVKAYKPNATKKKSNEVYLIGIKKK